MRFGIFLLLFLATTPQLVAQSSDFPYVLQPGGDVVIGSIALGTLSSAYLFHHDQPAYTAADFQRLDPQSVNAFDRRAVENYSLGAEKARNAMLLGTAGAAVVGTFIGMKHKQGDGQFSHLFWQRTGILAVMFAEGLSFNLGASEWAKNQVQRARPYAYNPNLSYSEKTKGGDYLNSFYSRTTALQWYVAGFAAKLINDLYPHRRFRIYVWSGAFVYSALQGYLAVRAGQHFPTDVMAGALLGGATGILLPQWHLEKHPKGPLTFLPGIGQFGEAQLRCAVQF